jgi:hypothetical protein
MRVNGALEALAARQASGILEIGGDPSGTVYFDQGQITCARASWIPGIGARLLGALSPPAGLLTGADEPDRDIGTFLVQRNYLTIQDLAAILRSVVVDTVIALTAPASQVDAIRFAPARAHWAAAFSCLDVPSVLAEAGLRARRMARYRLDRTTPVRLCDLGRPSAVLNRAQWALACAIDGAASPQDLAWRCGLALYETIENLGDLIAAGLVSTAPPPPWPGPVPPPAPALSPRLCAPPRLSAPPALAAEIRGPSAGLEFTPAAPDLLRRVLEGLRRNT